MEWWVDKRKDGWKAPTMDEWIDDSEGRGLGGYVRISIFISRTLRSANQQISKSARRCWKDSNQSIEALLEWDGLRSHSTGRDICSIVSKQTDSSSSSSQ